MDKKGNHVEVIISFIIFVVFVIFILAASRPAITKQNDKSNLLGNLQNEIINKLSSDVKVVVIAVDYPAPPCITLDNSISNLNIGNRIVVKDYLGNDVDASESAGKITLNNLEPDQTSFRVYYSEEFGSISSGSACASAGERIGLVKTQKYIFQKTIEDEIDKDYNGLKEKFNVPEKNEFTFGIILADKTLIEKPHNDLLSSVSTNIYVKDKPIEYIDLNGNIKEGYLKIKIW